MYIHTKRGVAPVAAIIVALLIIAGGAYVLKKGIEKRGPQNPPAAAKEETAVQEAAATTTARTYGVGSAIHFALNEQNKSGEKGEVTITQTGTSTIKVIVNITGKPAKVAQPAHIHVGACPNPGAVKYPLTSVSKGAAQTQLPISLGDLLSQLPLAVNVHKSASAINTYVACGNVEVKQTGSTDEQAGGQERSAQTKRVTYTANGFSPKTITISKSDTVTFVASGGTMWVASNNHPSHTLYSGTTREAHCTGGPSTTAFDQCGSGGQYSFTFDKTGTWGYHDHLEASNTGTVIVK